MNNKPKKQSNMKKTLFSLFVLMSIAISGKAATDDSKYLAGAVPEDNGIVTFKKTFSVQGKSAEVVRETMRQFVNDLVDKSIPAPGNYAGVMQDNDEEGIVARCCEWMVFKKKPMYLDRTRFRYKIQAKTEGNRVSIVINTITYYYDEDMETQNGVIIKAENWISDSEALNKAKTKLYPKSGKFRRKTVDRIEEIFNQAMDAFVEKPQPSTQPTRNGIIVE